MRAKAIMDENSRVTKVDGADLGTIEMFDGIRDTQFLNGDRHMAGFARGYVILLVGVAHSNQGIYRAIPAEAARQLARGLIEMADRVEAGIPAGTVFQ